MYIRIYMYIYIYKYINTSIYLYVEDLTVGYDGSVRNSEDNLVQVKPHPTYNIYIYIYIYICGAWRAEGRALHALCLAGSPMGWPNCL